MSSADGWGLLGRKCVFCFLCGVYRGRLCAFQLMWVCCCFVVGIGGWVMLFFLESQAPTSSKNVEWLPFLALGIVEIFNKEGCVFFESWWGIFILWVQGYQDLTEVWWCLKGREIYPCFEFREHSIMFLFRRRGLYGKVRGWGIDWIRRRSVYMRGVSCERGWRVRGWRHLPCVIWTWCCGAVKQITRRRGATLMYTVCVRRRRGYSGRGLFWWRRIVGVCLCRCRRGRRRSRGGPFLGIDMRLSRWFCERCASHTRCRHIWRRRSGPNIGVRVCWTRRYNWWGGGVEGAGVGQSSGSIYAGVGVIWAVVVALCQALGGHAFTGRGFSAGALSGDITMLTDWVFFFTKTAKWSAL